MKLKAKSERKERGGCSRAAHGSALCAICKTPLIRAVEKDLCAHCQDSIPEYIWADCDPSAPPSVRWAFYRSKADQRGNRPDLSPIRLRVSYIAEAERPAGRKHCDSQQPIKEQNANQ